MLITIKIKLLPSPEQKEILDRSLKVCKEAMNYISQFAWERKCFNRVALHHFIYRDVRNRFGLTAQITCAVKDKVAFTYKTDKTKQHIFDKAVLPLNPNRSFNLSIEKKIASISTPEGRLKIPVELADYHLQYLQNGWQIRSSEVIKNGEFYLHLVLEKPDPPLKEVEGYIGVDLGIKNIATISDGDFFDGAVAEKVRNRYERLRARLQSVGTPSAKRHLRKISGREKRFVQNFFHQISRLIVDKAFKTCRGIVLENLKGIHQRAKRRKNQRGKFHKWAFAKLIQFISYKAKMVGIPVFFVKPTYTSQRCSSCGYISKRNRREDIFLCQSCGFTAHSDLNASLNLIWAVAHQPIAP